MEHWELRGRMQPIKFSGEYVTLELQQHPPLCVDNWKITPESTPLKVFIDTYMQLLSFYVLRLANLMLTNIMLKNTMPAAIL